ncbi:MAG TPA: hypothetical protein VIU14_17610 [Mesorhizobium sp.]|jgi:hypothetical protein
MSEQKHFERQLKIARELMDRHRDVFAALTNPDSMSDEMKAGVEAARVKMQKYTLKHRKQHLE